MKKGVDYTGVTVVFCCHDGNGRFIMAQRSDKCRDEVGLWDIGGGGLGFDEKVEDALCREIKEEYCTEMIDSFYLGFRDAHRVSFDKNTHWIALDFLVQVNPLQVAIGEPEKLTRLEWFTLSTAQNARNLHSQLPLFWEKYSDVLHSKLEAPLKKETIKP